MGTIIIHTTGKKKMSEIKRYLASMDVTFEVKEDESPYNSDFVAKIQKSSKQATTGKVAKIKTEDLWK
jgi:inosine/xanthosine triphosphate pyrophosphatase family protein